MIFCKQIGLFAVALAAYTAAGSGFALYEPSTKSQSLGGAVLGKAVDASANFWNPATLSDLTNAVLTVGFITEHPYCDVKVDGNTSSTMNPGCFMLPHFMYAMPLPWNFSFGLGFMPEYGLGSRYKENWEMNWSSYETTVQGYGVNPNLSYEIADRLSIGGGFRVLFFDFEQFSHPLGGNYGRLNNRLKGSNRWADWGWQIGTRYRITDDLSIGFVYKSELDVRVKGRSRSSVNTIYSANPLVRQALLTAADASCGGANCDLDLPQSLATGLNWDITDALHFGTAVSWTQWSSVDTLIFELPSGDRDIRMKWNDTWRFGFGASWDFAESWSLLGSYVFDQDCTGSQASTMLPPAHRHIATTGLAWRFSPNLEFALSYGLIIMDGGDMTSTDALGRRHTMAAHHGFSHAVGFSVTYGF